MQNETQTPSTLEHEATTPTASTSATVAETSSEAPPSTAVTTPTAVTPPAPGVSSLNLSGPDNAAIDVEAEIYRSQSVSGARWFFWIAGLSLVNSVVFLAEGQWNFLAGLGLVQLISGIALGLSEELGGTVKIIAFVLDLGVAAAFVGLGYFAQKHYTLAFVVGLVIYALDGLIFLLVQDWLAIAFHVFVLYCLYRGMAANRKLKGVEAELAAAPA